jgi:AcrR family transcriptional regulator
MKQLRADAQRNLERVLGAAEELFAERGSDVSIDQVAQRAGVGHATVCRRFPSKEALVAAVIVRRILDVGALAETALREDDPAAGFERFAWQVAELKARDRALFEGFAGPCAELPEVLEAHAEVLETVRRLVVAAQEAGEIRSDVDPDEVPLLLASTLTGALQMSPPGSELWRRHLAVVLDGLRPPAS